MLASPTGIDPQTSDLLLSLTLEFSSETGASFRDSQFQGAVSKITSPGSDKQLCVHSSCKPTGRFQVMAKQTSKDWHCQWRPLLLKNKVANSPFFDGNWQLWPKRWQDCPLVCWSWLPLWWQSQAGLHHAVQAVLWPVLFWFPSSTDLPVAPCQSSLSVLQRYLCKVSSGLCFCIFVQWCWCSVYFWCSEFPGMLVIPQASLLILTQERPKQISPELESQYDSGILW